MQTIKYKIAGTNKEGLVAAANIISVQPGDRPDTCYIQVSGRTSLKADNSVEDIATSMAGLQQPLPAIINITVLPPKAAGILVTGLVILLIILVLK